MCRHRWTRALRSWAGVFTRPQLMNAAALAKMAGWHRLALDILHPLACDRQDIQARDKYFHLALLSGEVV